MSSKLSESRLAVLGAGKLGGILLRAYLKQGLFVSSRVTATVRHAERAAALSKESGIAVTTDMLVAGRHFFVDAAPGDIGHKSLAVNLSDLAAAGAEPRCFFLSLALPAADEAWLDAFSGALLALADDFACVLAGGDTTRTPVTNATRGPLTISITAIASSVTTSAERNRRCSRPAEAPRPPSSLSAT